MKLCSLSRGHPGSHAAVSLAAAPRQACNVPCRSLSSWITRCQGIQTNSHRNCQEKELTHPRKACLRRCTLKLRFGTCKRKYTDTNANLWFQNSGSGSPKAPVTHIRRIPPPSPRALISCWTIQDHSLASSSSCRRSSWPPLGTHS